MALGMPFLEYRPSFVPPVVLKQSQQEVYYIVATAVDITEAPPPDVEWCEREIRDSPRASLQSVLQARLVCAMLRHSLLSSGTKL